MGEGRHWTDHEDKGWRRYSDGFETFADRMVEKLGLERGEAILWGEACKTVSIANTEVGNTNMSKKQWGERIKETTMGGDYDLASKDGTKLDNGQARSGWKVHNQF